MNDKLKALPDDALVRLKEQVDEEFKRRRNRLFAIGKHATFFSERYGREVRILITGRGPKNLVGFECDEYGNKVGPQWRCHPSTLTPVLPKPKPVAPAVGVGRDAPASAMAGAF